MCVCQLCVVLVCELGGSVLHEVVCCLCHGCFVFCLLCVDVVCCLSMLHDVVSSVSWVFGFCLLCVDVVVWLVSCAWCVSCVWFWLSHALLFVSLVSLLRCVWMLLFI